MTFKDCLLAEYVEVRLDTYETRPCSCTAAYRPWAWIRKLSGGTGEDCTDIAKDGDVIMDMAQARAERSGTVRGHAWAILEERGIVHAAKAQQPGDESCASCKQKSNCTIEVSRRKAQAWIAEQFKRKERLG
jgi:hypothetical protein